MSNITKSTSTRTTSLISAAFFAIFVIVTALVLDGPGQASFAQAQDDCAYDVCQNESAEMTINDQQNQLSLSFSANTNQIYEDQEVRLSWNTQNADTLSAGGNAGSWQNAKALNGSYTENIGLQAARNPYTLRLTATGAGGQQESRQLQVRSLPRPTILRSFTYENSRDSRYIHADDGADVSLAWTAQNEARNPANSIGSLQLTLDGSIVETFSNFSENNYLFDLAEGEYELCMNPLDSLGDVNDSNTVICRNLTVSPPPPRYTLTAAPSSLTLNGEPGSTVTTEISHTSENNFSGDIDLDVEIPSPYSSRITTDFFASCNITEDDTPITDGHLSGEASTVCLRLTTNVPITTEDAFTISVNGQAEDSDVEEQDSVSVDINTEAYNPRTIEEF